MANISNTQVYARVKGFFTYLLQKIASVLQWFKNRNASRSSNGNKGMKLTVKDRIILQKFALAGTVVLELLSIILCAIGTETPKIVLMFVLFFAACIIAQIARLKATSDSRTARREVEVRVRSISKSISKTIIILIILAIIVREDPFGVGKMITNTFPWTQGVANYIVKFINDFVAEIGVAWHNLIP